MRRNSEGTQSTLRRIVQVRLEMISGQSAKEKDYTFQPSLKLSMIFQLTTNFSHLWLTQLKQCFLPCLALPCFVFLALPFPCFALPCLHSFIYFTEFPSDLNVSSFTFYNTGNNVSVWWSVLLPYGLVESLWDTTRWDSNNTQLRFAIRECFSQLPEKV